MRSGLKERKWHLLASSVILAATMTGCGSITGLIDATDEFGCPRGSGVNCTTLSETYARAHPDKPLRVAGKLEGNARALPAKGENEAKGDSHDSPHVVVDECSGGAVDGTSNRTEGVMQNQTSRTSLKNGESERKESLKERAENDALEAQVSHDEGFPDSVSRDGDSTRLNREGSLEGFSDAGKRRRTLEAALRHLKGETGNSKEEASLARAPERVVMLWILPWVDTDGDLHGESRLWVRVRDARWRIEALRSRSMRVGPAGETP